VDLSAFAGQTVRLVVEAADASTASPVEAAVDEVTIIRAGRSRRRSAVCRAVAAAADPASTAP
jgi:hypothetical protein